MAEKKSRVKEDVKNQFRLIRNAGVPLCAIETPDPAATIVGIQKLMDDGWEKVPMLSWDIALSLKKVTKAGAPIFEFMAPDGGVAAVSNPMECLSALWRGLEEQIKEEKDDKPSKWREMIFFFHNAHRLINEQGMSQAIWNLREYLKALGGVLVLLGPSIRLPEELKHDVVVISDPLPGEEELWAVVESVVKDTKVDISKITEEKKSKIIDILRGLSAFAAEQVVAMSLKSSGIDEAILWERKRRMIEQTPGLQVWTGGETFEQLGGLQNLKSFLTGLLQSEKTPIRAILYIDEIEKSMGGVNGDLSGTSQDQLGVMLRVMQDHDMSGVILVGAPGTGKSAIAKATGNISGIPVVACDLGAMKGSLVGESEAKIRAAMDVFLAISNEKALVVATCNKLAALPPELKRRFSMGTFYVDLPGPKEQKKIWEIWLKRLGFSDVKETPECDGWTGAEIRACCDVAYRAGLTLDEAAKFVVPVSKSAPESIAQLRKLASGKFIDAHVPGMYDQTRVEEAEEVRVKKGRRVVLTD